ncbi:MAG: hypothetical protein KBD37_00280 [Burkholderiales bacterium]|nr:hypothetical protein [Burkholderiales bacterium]
MLQNFEPSTAALNCKRLTDYINHMKEAQLYIRQCLNERIGIAQIPQFMDADKVRLTPREYEILFLLFIGKTDYEVAQYLSKIHEERAGRTMIGFKMSLFNKLKVYSNEELINKVLSLDLIKDIPESFIRTEKVIS